MKILLYGFILILIGLIFLQTHIIVNLEDQIDDLEKIYIPRAHDNGFELGRVTGCSHPNDTIRYTLLLSDGKHEYYKNRCGDTYRIINGEIVPGAYLVIRDGWIMGNYT